METLLPPFETLNPPCSRFTGKPAAAEPGRFWTLDFGSAVGLLSTAANRTFTLQRVVLKGVPAKEDGEAAVLAAGGCCETRVGPMWPTMTAVKDTSVGGRARSVGPLGGQRRHRSCCRSCI